MYEKRLNFTCNEPNAMVIFSWLDKTNRCGLQGYICKTNPILIQEVSEWEIILNKG